jgi:hypothetical protein
VPVFVTGPNIAVPIGRVVPAVIAVGPIIDPRGRPVIPGGIPIIDPWPPNPRIDVIIGWVVINRIITEPDPPPIVPSVIVMDMDLTGVIVGMIGLIALMTLTTEVSRMVHLTVDIVTSIVCDYVIARILQTGDGKINLIHGQERIAGNIELEVVVLLLMVKINLEIPQIKGIS